MNWLTNFVRPKLRALVARKEAPENLWLKCPSCEQMLFHRDLDANQQVCNHCNHHLRMRPAARLGQALKRRLDRIEAVAQHGVELGAGFRQGDAAHLALEERDAGLLLQPSDLMADRRRRHEQFRSRQLEAHVARRSFEGAQLCQGRQLGHGLR